MALGMFLFSAVDTQAKFLTESLHPIQIVWTRQLGLLVGVLFILGIRGRSVLVTRNPRLQILRGLLAASSATLFIVAVAFVPLADAVAVSFVAPFMVTLMGAFILREPVGLSRWLAVCLGFVGAMIVIRPGMSGLHPAAFLVVLAAFFFAGRQIISRYLAAGDPVVTTVAYTALVGSAALTLPLPFVWQWPQGTQQIMLLISIAMIAAIAEYLVIKALDLAQAVAMAPIHYSLLIWGTFYGFVVFGDLPDFWTWIGATVIIASGMYTLRR